MANSALDNFCGSTFWNRSLTWDTDDPDLTPCFEKTVLIWIPCIFLWVFACLEAYYILNSKKRDVPWNFLNISKIIVTGVLCILTLCDLVSNIRSATEDTPVHKVDIYSPLIKLLSFTLSIVLICYNRKCGMQTSGLLFLFWFLLAVFGVAQFRTEIRSAQKGEPDSYYSYVSYLIYYPLVLLMFLLNCFADRTPCESKYPKTERPCPEAGASFLSKLLFTWFDGLTWRGFRKPLEPSDLWDMMPEDSAKEVVPLFEKHWKNTLAKAEGLSSPTQNARAEYKSDSARVAFVNGRKKTVASVLPALFKSFGMTFFFGALLKLCQDLLTFISPQILGYLINFARMPDKHMWQGYFYAVLLLVVSTVQTLFLSQYFNRMFVIGMRIRTALVSTIYRKALTISNSARKESTVGEIVNLMSVDAQKFVELTAYVNMIWSGPLQICVALYFLWQELGPSVLAGLAVMIVLIPINGYIADKMKNLQIKQMKNKDERVKLMNEVLSGIKVLKLYAWEPSFEEQILKIRDKEIRVLRKAAYLNAGTSFIWSCAPFLVVLVTFLTFVFSSDDNILTPEKVFKSIALFSIMSMPMGLLPLLVVFVVEVSLVTFATYVLVDDNNVLDANKAYVSISLFNILRFPMSMLPMMITNLIQTYVSVQRINKFMNAEELEKYVTHDPSEGDPLVIENGTFSWGEDPTLKNLNVRVPKKHLIAVVGTVGSGKSSLVSAFLGEMDKISGSVNTIGTIAYVPQQAWIQNATLQDNILFGRPYDKILYDKVILACALKPDFDMLPAGDQTEIGEKGINLSGGQKQRVSLARAVYSDADVYFLDDPLSAVDSHVGKHIFEQVLGPKGLLKDKTRLLVTHGITFLPQTDKIVVLKGGEISETGSYQELLNLKGAFAEFLLQHIQEDVDNVEELDEIQNQLGDQVPKELSRELVRHRSRVSESHSETGSTLALNGSLQRQKSVDSSKSLKNRSGSVDATKGDLKEGEKLIEAEKAETGSVSWAVYKHYLKAIGIFLTLATVFLNMCFQGFSIGSNIWLGIWAEDSKIKVNGTIDTGRRDMYLGVYGALGLGQVLGTIMADLFIKLGAISASTILHNILLAAMLHFPVMFFDTTPMGRILSRFSKDIDTVDNTLSWVYSDTIYIVIKVIGTLFVISYTTPLFILVIIPKGILYYFIQRFYVATSRQLKRLESISRSPIYSHFGETITGVQTIRAYSQQDRFTDESEKKVDTNQVCYYPSIISNRWLAIRLEIIGNLVTFFAAFFAVLAMANGAIAPGLVGLTVTYALQITQTLNWLVRMTADVETNIVAVERIKEYGEAPQEAPWEIPDKKPPMEWPEQGSIEFQNYATRYRPGLDLVLKGVSFSVKGGEKVGIVGRTGAGKSSLTLALFRIIEASEGRIKIDNVNIHELGLHTLRSQLTIIPQDAVLFSGSLRMNLDPFSTHSDEDVWRSLEHAHLKVFVKASALIAMNIVFTNGSLRAAKLLHNFLLNNVFRLPMQFFDVTPLGRILARFSNDVQGVDVRLPGITHALSGNILRVLGTLFVISYTTPLFILVIIPKGILYYFIQRFYVATSRQLKRLESISRSPIYSHFGETITGVQTIRAYSQQDRFTDQSEKKVDTNQVCYYPSIISNRWLAIRLEMIGNLVTFFAALFAVLAMANDAIVPGLVGLTVSYALQITQTLNWLVRMTADVETNIVAVERIKEYGETPQEAPWEIPNKKPPVEWPEHGSVEFQNYATRYRPGLDLVLKGVSFNIKGGEKVGIVGRTGAGKSSLTLALFRIIEASQGRIKIDNVNIDELGLHTLRSQLTIIPQDAVLFSGSLRMNLDPFSKHSDEDVWRSLEHAHLKHFVKGLSLGLHHEISEGGENLSAGQRQLVCLARALLRKTKVLVLDEATAAVDLETDDLIQKTIRSEFKECTVLTIAHRLNTIMDSDRVIVLDKGIIAEFDSPKNLLANAKSIFYGMCKDAGLA